MYPHPTLVSAFNLHVFGNLNFQKQFTEGTLTLEFLKSPFYQITTYGSKIHYHQMVCLFSSKVKFFNLQTLV